MRRIQSERNNKYASITDIDILITIEKELQVRSDESSNDEVKEEQIRLYKRFWELQPDDKRHEQRIVECLLQLGWDLKRTKVNYDKARRFFEDLLEMKKPARVPIANYRLGFIHYYNHEWQNAINHFQKALGGMMPNRLDQIESWAILERSQLIKTNARLAMAYRHLSIKVAELATNQYHDNEEIDDSSISYIQELEREILVKEIKPYLCIEVSGRSRDMNDIELRQLMEDEEAVILNCTIPNREFLSVSETSYSIDGRNLRILRMLFESREPIPQWKLEFDLNLNQSSVYMRRLRDFLVSCELDREDIVAHNGYQWVRKKTYLVKSKYDVGDMF